MSAFYVGGAAGNCPRVRKVTDCPSTYIVLLKITRVYSKQNKHIGNARYGKFKYTTPLRCSTSIRLKYDTSTYSWSLGQHGCYKLGSVRKSSLLRHQRCDKCFCFSCKVCN